MKHLLLALLFVPLAASAQKQFKSLRFIPLGELPAWEEELIDGVRVQKDPPPGSLPPKAICIPNGEEDMQSTDLVLRQPSKALKLSAELAALRIHEGKQPTGSPLINAKAPPSKYNLGVLFRDNATMSWDSPKLLMLSDDARALPAGSIRFVNVSDSKAIVKVGKGKAEQIEPGKTLVTELKEGPNNVIVGYYEGTKVRMIYQNTIRIVAGLRVQAFLYKGQGKKSGDRVKFLHIPESTPK